MRVETVCGVIWRLLKGGGGRFLKQFEISTDAARGPPAAASSSCTPRGVAIFGAAFLRSFFGLDAAVIVGALESCGSGGLMLGRFQSFGPFLLEV